MTGSLGHWTWCLLSRAVLGAVLGGVLLATGDVRAQSTDDTSRVAPTGVEPAGLDSLPTGEEGAPPRPVSSPSDTGESSRVLVNADSLSTHSLNGERVQEMFGNVFVRQDTTRLQSAYGRRYLRRSDLLFIRDVVIYERGDTLRADTVRYDRATEVGDARGAVRLTNGDVDVRADSARYYASEKRSVFPDSVVLVDDDRELQAQRGTYWSDEGRAEFGGRVRLTEPGVTLLADSLTYYRDRDRSIAYGNVFIDRQGDGEADADTTARTYLFGDRADNREARRYSRVEGDALLVRVRMDSTGAPSDTLVVRARRLEAFRTDTHRRLVAVDSVRIWQRDLSAVADSAVYDRVVATSPDSLAGRDVSIDTTRPSRDSLTARVQPGSRGPDLPSGPPPDTLQEESDPSPGPARGRAQPVPDTSARAAAADTARRPGTAAQQGDSRASEAPPGAWATPTAQADSSLPIEETRLFQSPMTWFEDSQVWGDSIRVRARDRSPDTVFVRGSGFAAQRDSVLDRIQQLKAETITAFFGGGALRRIRARPNARAIRFLAAENDSLNGAARTSGDRIALRFVDESVERVSVIGGTQTTYYRNNETIPDPFELEGFQWTPDRRPTPKELLRDARVRRRLVGNSPEPRRPGAGPIARPGVGRDWSAQPDSSTRAVPGGPFSTESTPLLFWQDPVSGRLPPDSTARPGTVPDSLRTLPHVTEPADTTDTPPTPDS